MHKMIRRFLTCLNQERAEAEEPAARAPFYVPQVGTIAPSVGFQPGGGLQQATPSIAPAATQALDHQRFLPTQYLVQPQRVKA